MFEVAEVFTSIGGSFVLAKIFERNDRYFEAVNFDRDGAGRTRIKLNATDARQQFDSDRRNAHADNFVALKE